MPFAAGLRRQEQVHFIKATEGLDTLRKDLDIGAKADIAQNLRFTPEVGSVTKRPPLSYYNTAVEAGPITGVYRYYRETNNTQYLIQLNLTTLRVSTGGAFTTLKTMSGSSGKRFTALTYGDLAIVSTGYDNIVQTDGEVAWELGSCKAVATLIAGTVTVGTHYYAIVFQMPSGNKINGAVSNTVTVDGTHGQVTLTNIPQGPTGCTGRQIYRTAAGGSTLKLLHTIADNSTQTYIDNIADGSLTTDMPAVTDDMPKGLYLYVDQERLFVANDPTGIEMRRSTIYYSEQYLPHLLLTESTNLATTDAAGNYEVITPDDGDVITGMASALGVTFIFKQNSIRYWSIQGTPDNWSLSQTLTPIGAVAPYSIAVTPKGIIYQGWDHMYIFNGQYAEPIIDTFYFPENFLDSRRYDNVGYYWNNLYLLAYTDANDGTSYHNRVMIYDMLRDQMSIDKGGPLTSGQVNVNCFTSFRGTNEWGQLYAGDSVLGWVYQYDRSINSTQLNTITGLNLGTYSNSMASGRESNPILSAMVLDDMENYTTDALAQAAWVTSATTASTKVPSDVGDGSEGAKTVSADETIAGATYNWTNLTVDAGKTLTVSDTSVVIKCLGTVTINGAVDVTDGDLTILCHTLTIGAAGQLKASGNRVFKANTINGDPNLGGVSGSPIIADTHEVTEDYQGYAGASTPTLPENPEFAYDGSDLTAYGSYSYHGGSGDWGYLMDMTSTQLFTTPINMGQIHYKMETWAQGNGSYGNGSERQYVDYKIGGSWINLYDSGALGNFAHKQTDATTPGTWNSVQGIRIRNIVTVGGDRDGAGTNYIYEIEAYSSPTCYYLNGTCTVPTADTTDFVNPLEVYSDQTVVEQGDYSLEVHAIGSSTLNQYIEKTMTVTNLTALNTILIDVWSFRAGTNIQFGMGNTAYSDNLKNIVVTDAQTWTTYQLDFTGVTKNAIIKLGIKVINADASNIVYIENIRPAITTCSYLSSRFEINAQTMGSMYWNEVLTDYGDIKFYTRTSDSLTAFTSWTDDTGWSAVLTNPAGSLITSSPLKYLQFKVVFTTSDTTGINFPYIYKANGYDIRFTYWKNRAIAENSVEFRYRTGWRNFDEPFYDKIYRKLIALHEGTAGYFDCIIETDMQTTQTKTFSSVPLATYPSRWYTTLPDNMYGKELRLEWYKNDNEDFKLRQFSLSIEMIAPI